MPNLLLTSMELDPANQRRAALARDLAQVWGQWCAIGMRGRAVRAVDHVIDPEPLILASLVLARYDPLLLDGLLSWLDRHGALVNLHRLRTLAREADPVTRAALAAVAAIVGRGGDKHGKWRPLDDTSALVERLPEGTPFFLYVDGRPRAAERALDPDFLRHGLRLSSFGRRLRAGRFPSAGAPSLLLRLRALCGLSMRCEILCVLGSCASARPAEVAAQVAQTPRATQKVLVEMARSGCIGQVRVLRRRAYALSPNSPLASLLRPGGAPTPWVDSIATCRALAAPWIALACLERDQGAQIKRHGCPHESPFA